MRQFYNPDDPVAFELAKKILDELRCLNIGKFGRFLSMKDITGLKQAKDELRAAKIIDVTNQSHQIHVPGKYESQLAHTNNPIPSFSEFN